MANRNQKPKEELAAYKRKQEAIQKRKDRHEAMKRKRQLLKDATSHAIQELAVEAFGPGGLTPARKEALVAIAVGPVEGDIAVNTAAHLQKLIRDARKKFHERAALYVDTHFNAVKGALANGDYDTAARHSQWALESMGDKDDRIVTPPSKTPAPAPPAPIMVGVNLGGMQGK